MKKLSIILALLTLSCPLTQPVKPLNDLAITEGNEIRIDTYRAQNLPPLVVNFLLLHELGHVILRHSKEGKDWRQVREMELEADCWAGRHSLPEEKLAAIDWFRTMGPVTFDKFHYSGYMRAVKIWECS